MSVSSVAPAYALTATLGLSVTEVGVQAPAIFLIGFLPMLLVAYAYRELNKAVPDAGTSFTWTVKAFGPHIGWMCGWGLVLAIIIVLSNLAGVAVTFLYLFLAEILGNADIATWGDGKVVNVATCLAFVAIATYIAYRGMTTTKGVTYVLLTIQMVALVLFIVLALTKATNGDVVDGDRLRVVVAEPVLGRVVLRPRDRAVAVDLHVLGLGHLPVGERGDDAAAIGHRASPRCSRC